MVGPLTGVNSSVGIPILEGSKAAAQEINDAGGILGGKLKLDEVDTVSDPVDAVPALSKELAAGHPIALIGPVTTEIHAVEPLFDRAKIVEGFNGGSAQFDTNTDPLLWRCTPSDGQLAVAMALEARQKGYTRAATFMSTAAVNATLRDAVDKAFTALGGTIVGSESVTPAQTSYRSEVQKTINLHPDVIFEALEPATAGVAFSNFQELNGLAIPFIGHDSSGAAVFIKAVGPAVAKAHLISVQGSTALTSDGQAFEQYYQKVNGHAPLVGSAYAYDCTIVFALAITKAKSTNPAVWVNSITAVSNPPGIQTSDYKTAVADINAGKKIDYQGASGPMDFDKYHNVAGAWDAVQATGDTQGDVTTLNTMSASAVDAAIAKIAG